ncbi:MAG: histidinol-phosphatase [Nitrospira sp.]|nr:histidinol-phosphatase [Nitrospira sp.]HBP88531.1 histidinol-phosphatase [Nitrospiraceae bacterium]HNP30262.1 histidinol-phosphatase [Nitrospirales bacterium]
MENNINEDLTALFLSMAGLLASRGENPYKVKAYRRAADSLKSLQEDVTQVANRGELKTIPGIGKELSIKIEEFLSTGRIRAYEELKTPLPVAVREWITLPGFSEPIVHDLVFRLGITTWEDLEALAQSHLLQTLPGLGSRGGEILAAIQEKRSTYEEA